MSEWKPKVARGVRLEQMSLTPEEGFLLSRLDGLTPVSSLTHLTGLPPARVEALVRRLVDAGAIEAAAPAPVAVGGERAPGPVTRVTAPPEEVRRALAELSMDDLLDDDDDDDDDDVLVRGPTGQPPPRPLATQPRAATSDGPPPHEDPEALASGELLDDDNEDEDLRTDAERADDERADLERADEQREEYERAEDQRADDERTDDERAEDDKTAADGAEEEVGEVEEGNFRKLFELELHPLPQEEREKLARTEAGARLMALCFDPVPAVILRIFENSTTGFPHARLVARHHRTSQGLEPIFKRSELARDAQVQRWLLANPMLQDPQLKKLLGPKRLAAVYKWSLSRDLPERNRNKIRHMFRSKWSTAEAEERANLIFQTEGRVLVMLNGIPFDSQTTLLLCQRTIHSALLIQSLARFASTTPPILNHLLRQPVVKRQAHLKTMILQHPNCPSEAKRKPH
jgi:hypothetical protein